jgi:hypothetical protein
LGFVVFGERMVVGGVFCCEGILNCSLAWIFWLCFSAYFLIENREKIN